jgi:hypothetical protein
MRDRIDPDAGERTPDRDQKITTLRFAHGDADQARSLWGQYTQISDADAARVRAGLWPDLGTPKGLDDE